MGNGNKQRKTYHLDEVWRDALRGVLAVHIDIDLNPAQAQNQDTAVITIPSTQHAEFTTI